jgi:hypothetical protein
MFTKAGNFKFRITEAMLAEPRFAKGSDDFDVVLTVEREDDANENGYSHMEVSQSYGQGTMSTMTQAQITARTLAKIGFEGADLSTLEAQLVGKIVPGYVKERKDKNDESKLYYDVYLGGGGQTPVALDPAEAKRRAALLFGGAAEAGAGATTAPAPAATTTAKRPPAAPPATKDNPFTKK